MANTISVYWKRGSTTESDTTFSAYRKEGEVKTYAGVSIPGGRKFTIPDIEENQELIENFDGVKWSVSSPKETKDVQDEVEKITKPVSRFKKK